MNSPAMFYNDLIDAIYHNSTRSIDTPSSFLNERVVLTKETTINKGIRFPANTMLRIQKPLQV